jgi:transglutaminase-like putative cysteine protease
MKKIFLFIALIIFFYIPKVVIAEELINSIQNEVYKEQNFKKFLLPAKEIESDNEEIIKISKFITEGLKTDKEKFKAIYIWVISNISYDFDKYKNIINKNYSDEYGALVTLKSKKGVCYDFSALIAALSRAENIPAKLSMGYSENVFGYHAWVEFYDINKKEWKVYDPANDSFKSNKKAKARNKNEYRETSNL